MEARDRESGQVMPDGQLVSEIMTLVVAGHETTASTLNWAWYLLSQNPEIEKKLSRELNDLDGSEFSQLPDLPKFPYTRQVIDEAMRLYPPGWLMTRRALKDDQIGKYFVPAGTEIYISPYLIQRHPALWEEPDRFNPDRFDAAQLHDRTRAGDASVFGRSEKVHRRIACADRDADPSDHHRQTVAASVR